MNSRHPPIVSPARLLFRTGIPAVVQRHHVTSTLEYHGQVVDTAAAISELPSGRVVALAMPGTCGRSEQDPEGARCLGELRCLWE